MNIVEILRARTTECPDQPAFTESRQGRSRVTSFGQLTESAGRLASLLRLEGARPGEMVLVLQPMSAELYVALTAIFQIGAVAMILDPGAGRLHVERACEMAAPRFFLGSPKSHLLRIFLRSIRSIPRKWVIGPRMPGARSWRDADRQAPSGSIAAVEGSAPALLTFTSGSGGRPRAILRSHGFLLVQHRILEKHLQLTRGSIDLSTLPVFAMANLASGVTSLIPPGDLRFPGRIEPKAVLLQMDRHLPSSVVASPAFVETLADRCLVERRVLPGVKRVYTGGGPVFPSLLEKLKTVFPEADVRVLYGSSEAEPISLAKGREFREADWSAMTDGKGLLVGRPIEEIRARVLSNQWGRPIEPMTAAWFDKACRPAGQPGEIVVTGDHVLRQYWKGMGDAEMKFRVDNTVWHRTGDAGYFDAEGRLWLLGRCEAVIRDAEGALYPFAVEAAVHSRMKPRRVAMVGRNGRRILFVESDPSAAPDLARLQSALAWARIDEVRLLARIPVDIRHNAKVDYAALERLI